MNAPIADPNAVPDPSQVFADPSQMAAMQGGAAPAPDPSSGGDPAAAPAEQQPGHDYPAPLDVEGCIASAIESGCHLAEAAQTAEDYARFSQGVSFLAAAMKDLQPQPNPGDAQYASTLLTTAQRDAQAHLQHDAAMAATEARARAAASRPKPSPPSARG